LAIEFVLQGWVNSPVRFEDYVYILSRHIANNALFIDIATILWTLTIEPARNNKGEYFIPDTEGNANASIVL
jgi:hypothetical protein